MSGWYGSTVRNSNACFQKPAQKGLCMNVINLTLHGVGSPRADSCVNERAVWLGEMQFRGILDVVQSHENVCVTIDDGNVSDVEIVGPALKERDLAATFFVPLLLLDRPGYLTRTGLLELRQMGFGVGSHGLRHCDWRLLDDKDLWAEVRDSRDMLEQMLGTSILTVSCPLGSYDRRVLRFLKEAGYKTVYTSDRGTASRQAWLQARNALRANDDVRSVYRMLSKGPWSLDFMMCRLKTTVKRCR